MTQKIGHHLISSERYGGTLRYHMPFKKGK